MSARLTLACFTIGAADLAYAAFLITTIQRGFVHAWLGWGVPLLIAAGVGMWTLAFRRYRRERA